MLALVLYIFDDPWNFRPGNRKHTVSILPGEIAHIFEFTVNPERRVALQILRGLAWRNCGWGADESMDVFFHAADLNRRHFMLAGNAAKVSPNAFFNLRIYPIDAVLRAENDV